jgi:hypothetical protein
MTRKKNHLKTAATNGYDVKVVSDGDTTMVEILAKWMEDGKMGVIGTGRAKRRKGDRRDERLGQLLAFERAFQDAVRTMDDYLESCGYGDYVSLPVRTRVDVDRLLKRAQALRDG